MDRKEGLSRRRFLQGALQAAAWGAGLPVLGALPPRICRAAPASAPTPPAGRALAAVKGEAAQAARRAVDLLGGMGRFVRPGQRVVVKPNIGWDRTPEQGANTSPEVVAAVVRACLEAGAGEVLVFDRTCNDQRLCYRRSGIEAAVEGVGDRRAKIFQPDERRFVPVRITGGRLLGAWEYYEDALKADVFVSVPVAKDHAMSRLTMGLKNIMGILGGNRGQIHTDFEDKIVDLNLARPTHLVVLDASRILVAHGPQGGRPVAGRRPGVVVAGTDLVAVDAYATRFFGLRPQDVPHIVRAHERGLGTMDLAQVALREEGL